MIDFKQGSVLFVIIMTIGFIVGGFIQAACFFGLVTLIGLIVVVETVGPLKWFIRRTSKIVDVIILVATIIATASLGLTVVGGLTIAGIGYSLVYAPYIRQEHKKLKANREDFMPSRNKELWNRKK